MLAALVGSFFLRSLLPHAEKAHAATAAAPHHPDSPREIIETVVFVVVLVLLLKSFVAEAFVIPTGSMAETLWGYQKVVTCPQCGFEFPVNCSSEVDPPDDEGFGRGLAPTRVSGCTCPNCRQEISLVTGRDERPAADPGAIPDPGWRSGDRVLVAKFVYDLLNKSPDRLDVVVFKYPGDPRFPLSGPVKRHVPINYIKRLIGLPNETIGVYRGKLWVLPPDRGLRYDDADGSADPGVRSQLWQIRHTHHNDPEAVRRFHAGEFQIVRKNPKALLAMRRIVYDNDHPARDVKPARWVPAGGWTAAADNAFHTDGSSETEWVRYRHLLRRNLDQPQLITDFMGYNTGSGRGMPGENWASDLMLECQVQVEQAAGQFTLELSRGPDRFQTVFDLASGECRLVRLEGGKRPTELKSAPSAVRGPGTYTVRFANCDDRLTVWVNDRLVFGDGVEYGPVAKLAPTRQNDLERPASLGAQGAKLTVSKVKLFRDTYYTTNRTGTPSEADAPNFRADDPETWSALENVPVSTYYVQPDHFLCLGDNSPESSDGRTWGLVPQRLLLGRALLVYYPFSRAGRIR
ncbi:MAG: S26 family signal peptidase [Gemmataceae bacterium]